MAGVARADGLSVSFEDEDIIIEQVDSGLVISPQFYLLT